MKERPTYDELCAHACTTIDCCPMVCATNKKPSKAGENIYLYVDLTTFRDYDDMIEFCKRFFQQEKIFILYGLNFPAEYIDDEFWYNDIIQFADLEEDQKNAIYTYIWYYGVRGVHAILDIFIGTFVNEEEAAKYIVENNLLKHELPDNIKNCKDYDQVYEYLRDRILIADDFYYLADE